MVPEGYGTVANCLIVPRADSQQPLFWWDSVNQQMHCHLDGYAIVPREKYEELEALAATKQEIRSACQP